MKMLSKRFAEWEAWRPSRFGVFMGLPDDPTLMYQAGQTIRDDWEKMSWPTLTSMRGVDASAEAGVTHYFNRPEAQEE